MNYYVYEYVDPRNNLPFYIGKGTKNRCMRHLKETADNTENKRKYEYIQALRNLGLSPLIRKIGEDMPEDEAYNLEESLIAKYGRKGIDKNGILTNICSDARPPKTFGKDHHQFGKPIITKHTEETKKKISESKKGKESWHKGRTKSDATRAKMSSAQKNKIVTEKTKDLLSSINKGEGNPSYGSMWITNGTENMKIQKHYNIPEGWYKGRIFKEGYKKNVWD